MKDELYQRGMKLLTLKVANLDAAQAAEDRDEARDQFYRICGILNALDYLKIITPAQLQELTEDLFENHHYLSVDNMDENEE